MRGISPQVLANVKKEDRGRVKSALEAAELAADKVGVELDEYEVLAVRAWLAGGINTTGLFDALGVEQVFE